MTLSLGVSRDEVRARINASFAQESVEGSVPSFQELKRTNGVFLPYLVYNFADLGSGLQSSMIGPRGDLYYQSFNIYAIAPVVKATTDLYLKLLDTFLGYSPSYSSQISKRPGGGTFVISNDNGSMQAYISVASFQFTTELLDLEALGL